MVLSQKNIKEQIPQMMEDGIVQPSVSPWCSPVVMALKGDNSFRLCGDFRQRNKITNVDAYYLPKIDDI